MLSAVNACLLTLACAWPSEDSGADKDAVRWQVLRLQQVEVQLYEVWPQLWQLTGGQTWQQCQHGSLDWRQRA